MGLVEIVECPRDAWQGLPKAMPAEVKADYLKALIAAGFRHIDAVSFVSRAAVPQMADSELVLEYLDVAGTHGEPNAVLKGRGVRSLEGRGSNGGTRDADDLEIIAIVVNKKGAERAVKTGGVQAMGFPYSVSETFLKRNQSQTPEESVEALEEVGGEAQKAGMDLIGYISMAFGNPYGDAWSVDEVITACDLLIESGASVISLADTVGLATPQEVKELVGEVLRAHSSVEIGVHLHARPDGAAAKVRAAYEAGCRRFDSAIGGMGGCPFAQDALVGNIATEMLIAELEQMGAELPPIAALADLITASAEIVRKYGARVQ